MCPKKAGFGLGWLLLLGSVAPALAEPSKDPYPAQCTKTIPQSDSDLAHQKYIAGKTDFDEANYDSAIRRFRDAYNLDCTKHELLVIISAAYERKFDRREAVSALEAYVARAPTAPDVSTYQARIENLKRQIAAEPAKTAAPPPGAPAGENQGHTPYPWILVGVGATAIVAGVVILATTPDVPANCTKDTRQCIRAPNATDDQYDSERSQAGRAVDQPRVGFIFMGAGAALAIGGVLWHLLEPTGPKQAARSTFRPNVSPAVGGGFAGLSLDGRF